MEKKFEHICEICGGKYLSSITYGKCCSDKCRTTRWRRTEKGRACVVRSNKRHKRPDIKKVCIHCGKGFVTARLSQKLCSGCSPTAGAYIAQKKYRARFPKKARAGDIVNKRIQRGVSLVRELCSVCGNEAEVHHPNYNKPLEIVWLCKKHHVEEHRRLKELVKCE